MPKDSLQVIGKIERALLETRMPISLSRLAKKTGLHYTTVKRYVTLLESVKKMPTIEVIGTGGITLVRLERDLSRLREEEIKQIIKQHFPEIDEEEKLLIKILGRNASSKEKAVKIRITKFIESLIKSGRLRKTKDERVYLTDVGYGIACGAKKIYCE